MKEYEIRYDSLPNQVRRLEISIPHSELASCVMFVKTGTRNEVLPTEKDITHHSEHIVFDGSKKYPSYHHWAMAVDKLGGYHNGGTEREYVEFLINVEAQYTGKALEPMSELASPLYNRTASAKEKQKILREIDSYKDDLTELTRDLFQGLLYEGTSMERDTLGTKKSILSHTRGDLKSYVDKWYRGGNILVVTAGRVGKIRRVVENLFGQLPEGPIMPYEGTAGYGESRQKVKTIDTTDEAYFVIGVPGVARNDERYFAMRVMAAILGGDDYLATSRMYQNIQSGGTQTYDLTTIFGAESEVGYFAVQGTAKPSGLEKMLEKIRKELYHLSESTTKEEVIRAKRFVRREVLEATETTLGVAETMGIPTLIYDRVETRTQMLKKIEDVKLEDVRRLAESILIPDLERLVVAGPVNENLKRIRKFNPR